MTRMKFREVVRLPEFDRDMKKLVRRYKTLEEDLTRFVNIQLFLYHKAGKEDRGIVRIDLLGSTTKPVFKAKKFACLSMKGKGVRTGIRVVYAYDEPDDKVELIEIYHKSDQTVEDRKRIAKYYGE